MVEIRLTSHVMVRERTLIHRSSFHNQNFIAFITELEYKIFCL